MKNVIERSIMPYNPSPTSIVNKEKYMLFAPIARIGQPGIAAYNPEDFVIEGQTVRLAVKPSILQGGINDVDIRLREYIESTNRRLAEIDDQIAGGLEGGSLNDTVVLQKANQYTDTKIAENQKDIDAVSTDLDTFKNQSTKDIQEANKTAEEARIYAENASKNVDTKTNEMFDNAKRYTDDAIAGGMLTSLAQARAYTDSAISAGWNRIIVSTLPNPYHEGTQKNAIYMIKNDDGEYDEYMLIEDGDRKSFERIGNASVNLDGYMQIGQENLDTEDSRTYHGLVKRMDSIGTALEEQFDEKVNSAMPIAGYDLVITTDDEFDKCLYPLCNGEGLDRKTYFVDNISNDELFNSPDPTFTAKRILVKGVTFVKRRGYDDIQMHVFQPSIEYIKFEDCRWETRWMVSGENPRDPNAPNYNLSGTTNISEFKRATSPLSLTIEGLSISEDNFLAVPEPNETWAVGLRNVKIVKNSGLTYPNGYIPIEGAKRFQISLQYVDIVDACSISIAWHILNLSNSTIDRSIKYCNNVVNVAAVTFDGALNVTAQQCKNLVNVYGGFIISDCGEVLLTTALDNKLKNYREIISSPPSDNSDPTLVGYYLYAVTRDSNGKAEQTRVRARRGYAANEIAMRNTNGRLQGRPSGYNECGAKYYNGEIENHAAWDKSELVPRDYVDKLVKGSAYGDPGYTPLDADKKIPLSYMPATVVLLDKNNKIPASYLPLLDGSGKVSSAYLPGYVDDVLEGYFWEQNGETVFGRAEQINDSIYQPTTGVIYVDLKTNKSYRWNEEAGFIPLSSAALPEVSTSDAGKILRVAADGTWVAEEILSAEGGKF